MKNQATHIIRVYIASGFLLGEVPSEVQAILAMFAAADLLKVVNHGTPRTIEYQVTADPAQVVSYWKSFGFKAEHITQPR